MTQYLFIHSIEINRTLRQVTIHFCDEDQNILDTKLVDGPISYNGKLMGYNEGYDALKTIIREDRRVRLDGNEIILKVGDGPNTE